MGQAFPRVRGNLGDGIASFHELTNEMEVTREAIAGKGIDGRRNTTAE
jgi:hypothetical protein